MVNLNFNANQYEPKWSGGGGLPVSDAKGHLCVFIASEPKPTKDNPNNAFLELTAQIVEGPHSGMQGPVRLNLWNTSAQAVDIAHKQLSAICHCVGVFNLQDSSALHNRPLRLIVTAQPKKNPNDPNEVVYTQVSGVRDVNGNEAGKPPANAGAQTGQTTQAPTPQGNGAAQPWNNQGNGQGGNTSTVTTTVAPPNQGGNWQAGGQTGQSGAQPSPPWNR